MKHVKNSLIAFGLIVLAALTLATANAEELIKMIT